MTREEKAKAYDEALEKAKKFHTTESNNTNLKAVLELIFPELADSEDERVRKNLISFINLNKNSMFSQRECNEFINYLEKQKEGNLVEKRYIQEAFNKGMQAGMKQKSAVPVLPCSAAWFEDDEQKPVEEQDYSGLNDLERAIHRGFLCAGVENVPVTIIKETAKECLAQIKSVEWSDEDETRLKVIKEELERFIMFNQYGTPLSVDDIDWLKSLPERFNLPPKQEWSEENEEMLNRIIETLSMPPIYDTKACAKMVSWLKSRRSTWKPSKEQMEALDSAQAEMCSTEYNKTLCSLIDDLKKL